MNQANEARDFMNKLKRVARNTRQAVIVVHHTRKAEAANDATRALGSVDFINAIRSGLFVGKNKEGQKFLRHAKANWTKEGPSLGFEIEEGRVVWRELGPEEATPMVCRVPRSDAAAFLRDILACGPRQATLVEQAALQKGISVRTLHRAKTGVANSRKIGGEWFWELASGTDSGGGEGAAVAGAPVGAAGGAVAGAGVPRPSGPPVGDGQPAGRPAYPTARPEPVGGVAVTDDLLAQALAALRKKV